MSFAIVPAFVLALSAAGMIVRLIPTKIMDKLLRLIGWTEETER